MRGLIEPGAIVEVRGEQWRLARAAHFGECAVLSLEGCDALNRGQRLRVIDPFDRPHVAIGRSLRKTSRRTAIGAALRASVGSRHPDHLWTAAAASIEIWPYQLEPALAVIGGATRVLLADAVGLGKTIQAGLILSELRERGWVQHALILCPAGLRDGWARELRDRFDIGAVVLDQQSIADRIARLPPGSNPWIGHAVAVASIDLIKRPDVLAALDSVPIDLLIVDEAHHLTPGTDRSAAVSALAARTPWFVMASATPHSGDEGAYSHLLSIGTTGEPPTVFRRSRRAVGLASHRRTHVLTVRPRSVERQLHDVIAAYARELWRAHSHDNAWTRMLAVTLARRAASSAAAIQRTIQRRLDALAGVDLTAVQAPLPWEDEDDADLQEAGMVASAPGLADAHHERALLERALSLAGQCGDGSKLHRIRRIVRSIDEPVIVFTEYRDTLMAVVDALVSCVQTIVVHGGMTAADRVAAVDAFNRGEARVLVATDAAGEGLNLHDRCRLVVDVELPWNPLRLEQRIGRVDRIGQRRTVHAIRLCHGDSIEMRVLDHLRLRARRAAVAFDAVSERQVGDAVLGSGPADRPAATRDDRIETASSAASESERVCAYRRCLTTLPDIAGAWAFGRSRRLIVVTRTTFSSDGIARGEALNAHLVMLSAMPSSRAQWRSILDRIAARIEPAPLAQSQAPVRIATRIQVIRERLARVQARAFQRSLFDTRADRDATKRSSALAALDAALQGTLEAVGGAGSGVTSHVEIVSAWSGRTP